MRRDKNDKAWQKVKLEVSKRDEGKCRLVRIISIGDMYALKKNAGQRLSVIQPAHIYPVSLDTSIMYEAANIVSLNSYSHSMLDSMKDPISGKSISKDEVYRWWKKIAGDDQWYEIKRLIDFNKKERRSGR